MNVNAPATPSGRAGASVIIYGPQGCGKGYYAEDLRKFFGCVSVEEETPQIYRKLANPAWVAEFKRRNVLLLTTIAPPEGLVDDRRILHFKDAMRIAGLVNRLPKAPGA